MRLCIAAAISCQSNFYESFFIKFALIWCSARPCGDHTGFAQQAVHLLGFVMTRPVLALVQGAERRVILRALVASISRKAPSHWREGTVDSDSEATQRASLGTSSSSAYCVGGAHTEARVVAHTLRGQQPAAYATPYAYYDSLDDMWAWEPLAC